MAAAFKGSQEIGFTILSMTLSLAAVFIPMLFMEGILGRLFREFAVTICTAILISGMVSITLLPCCAAVSCAHRDQKHGIRIPRDRALLRCYSGLLCCDSALGPALSAGRCWRDVFRGAGWHLAIFYQMVPKGFIPETDNDQMQLNTKGARHLLLQDGASIRK